MDKISGRQWVEWNPVPFGDTSYVAPDWTADWLHREAMAVLNIWAQKQYQKDYDNLSAELQSSLKAKLTEIYRTNTYNDKTGTITIDDARLTAIKSNTEHYSDVFSNGRDEYAIPKNTLSDTGKTKKT